VNGLSCGIALLEAGFEVEIRTRDRTPNTTSDIAAAIYYPYRAFPEDRVIGWGKAGFDRFRELAKDAESGVAMRECLELFAEPADEPWWKPMMPGFRRAKRSELPEKFVDSYAIRVPVIEMPIYLRYLEHCFAALGGRIVDATIARIEALGRDSLIVVNCSGLGAREIAGDFSMFPIRGQIVRLKNPGLPRSVMTGMTYIIPRSHDVVVGGTADDNDWNLDANPATERELIANALALEPALKGAEILSRAVGLRPGRPEVRLEVERLPSGARIVHNYGHGGSGVTLSWGCALEVVELVRAEAAALSR
jgi:D-amino-acid oxidase